MIDDVKYKGFTATGSDYDCSDGELAAVMGLLPDHVSAGGNVSLSAIQKAKTVLKLGSKDCTVLYVHRGDKYTNYIVVDTSGSAVPGGSILASKANLYRKCRLYWSVNGKDLHELCDLKGDGLYRVSAVGNTLMLLTTSGVQYMLWEQEKSTYKTLGSEIPDISLRFGLQGELKQSDKLDVSVVNFDKGVSKSEWGGVFEKRLNGKSTLRLKIRDSEKKEITDYVLGYVNKFIAENYEKNGKFIYPFFVRYAYRLYDGSQTKHSAPILMMPSTDCSPICMEEGMHFYKDGDNVFYSTVKINYRVIGMVCDLDYVVTDNAAAIGSLGNWKDIVKSVDIYVSSPIYTYKQSGDIEYLNITPLSSSEIKGTKSVCRLKDVQAEGKYSDWNWLDAYRKAFSEDDISLHVDFGFKAFIEIPKTSFKSVIENVNTCRDFYLLKSINIEELTSGVRKKIDIDEYFLKALVNRQTMADDYDSHDRLTAKYSFVYNQRLNLAGLSKKLFGGFNPSAVNTAVNSDGIEVAEQKMSKVRAYVYVKQGGRNIVVESDTKDMFCNVPIYYFYYPNANAYRAIIRVQGGWEFGEWNASKERYFELPLESHVGLNGAFWFGNFKRLGEMTELDTEVFDAANIPIVSSSENRTVGMENKIYASKVNNPFVFPVLGITTVGVGEVYGVSTAAKALSEGQFGQFPLYAFTSDGVWALEVASNGAYSARQPITRDVCVDKDSITQIDSAVLFATARGIMMLSGSQSTCISDVLESEDAFSLAALRFGAEIIKLAGLLDKHFDYIPFRQYIQDSGMVFDYARQRIVLYNPTKAYAYVYSLRTKMWGMMENTIVHGVNSYPQALVMCNDGSLVDLSEYEEARETKVLFVTRPLKFGAPDVLKTVESVIQRGHFNDGSIKMVLYGSKDLDHWSVVWSSENHYLRGFSGSPYKYFRIVGFGSLASSQSLSNASVSLRGRFANQLR